MLPRALLACACLLAACGPSSPVEDSGLPPPRDSDAGTSGNDGGASDAGVRDGGVDAGPQACRLDAGPELPRDGGSLVCAPCSSATGCGSSGVCRFLSSATCTGVCGVYGESCADDGPEATRFTVTVEADSFACPGRHASGCDFRHDVALSTGQIALSIILKGPDGGVVLPYGAVPSLAPAGIHDASLRELWCVGQRDLFVDRCIERSFIVRVEAEAADAGVVARWPLRAGNLPPKGLHDAVTEVLRAGDPVFRAAGVPWTRTPP
ncbi:MAG: hypothetical protein AB1938_14670 [Myxococcota bacterium]